MLRHLRKKLWLFFNTEACMGCLGGRVNIIGRFPFSRRREAVYCRDCMGEFYAKHPNAARRRTENA